MSVRIRPRKLGQLRRAVNDFALSIHDRGHASADLLRPVDEHLEQDPALLQRALDELRWQHEELLVAEEELRAQVEELADAHGRADLEAERYAELFELAPDPQIITDLSGVIHEVNQAAGDVLGISSGKLRGKPILVHVKHAGSGSLHAVIDRLLSAPATTTTTSIACAIELRGVPAKRWAARISTAADRKVLVWTFRKLLVSVRDGVQHLEHALLEQSELLERERRESRVLREANEAKSRLLVALAHDLRSPLNATVAWLDRLRRETMTNAERDLALASIERNASAQTALLDELVDVGYLASRDPELELERLDLARLVADVVGEATASADTADVALSFAMPAGPLVVMGAPRRLAQLVRHLLANALKFTPPGGTIDVALASRGDSIELVVRDSGRGIEPDILGQLFGLKARTVAPETMPSRQGLGLGLYLVRRLAEIHFGQVRAESGGEGKGATLVLSLPSPGDLRPPSID